MKVWKHLKYFRGVLQAIIKVESIEFDLLYSILKIVNGL